MTYVPGAFPETSIYPGPYRLNPDLPTGDWNVFANGRIYTITIHGISGGAVKGEMASGTFKDGGYDAKTGILKFTRELPDGNPQYWSGQLMYYSAEDTSHRMAGTIDQPNIRQTGSWYATLARS